MNTIENQTEETVFVQETLPEQDLMESLMEQAQKRLEAIGSVGMEHILEALKDRDEKGRRMTSVEIREDHWDVGEGGILFGRQKAFSMTIEVQLEKNGGYTTVVLQFDDPASSDMERFWTVFTDYGKSAVKRRGFDLEVPVITLTAVPLTLGGSYGMIAIDPIYYTLQPSGPSETVCSQIRLLYLPESVIFLKDGSFRTEEAIAQVKRELAGERLAEEAWYKKEMEKEAFKKRREQETAQYLEGRRNPHSFRFSKQIGHGE